MHSIKLLIYEIIDWIVKFYWLKIFETKIKIQAVELKKENCDMKTKFITLRRLIIIILKILYIFIESKKENCNMKTKFITLRCLIIIILKILYIFINSISYLFLYMYSIYFFNFAIYLKNY
jgi:hypothetical protein